MQKSVPSKAQLEAAIVAAELANRRRTDGVEVIELQDYQRAFYESRVKRQLVHGGGRSGKSMISCKKLTDRIIKSRDQQYWLVCGSGWESHIEKVLVPWFERMVPRRYLLGGRFNYTSRSHILEFKNGSTIEFASYDQDPEKVAGRPFHGIWLDESYACPKRFRDQCLARLVDYHGEMWATLTPEDGDASWEIEWYEKARNREPGYVAFRFPTRQNKKLTPEAIQQLIDDCGDDEVQIAIRLDGDFASIGGKIYPILKKETHQKTDDEVGMTGDWTRFVAIDPGVAKEHAVSWGAVGPGNHIHFYRELAQAGEIGDLCDAIRRMSGVDGPIADFFIDGHWDWDNRTAVSKTDGEPLNIEREFIKNGLPVVKAPRDIRMWLGIDHVRERLRPDPISHKPLLTFSPECQRLWYEMTHYSQVRPGTRDPTRHAPRIRKVDDDFADVVRIAVTCNPVYEGGIRNIIHSAVALDEYGLGF